MDQPKAAVCGICKKPLSDAKSIERGIGPVCFGHLGGIEPVPYQREVFGPSFEYGIMEGVLWLEDRNNGQSLTNGMEQALRFIANTEGIKISNYPICYRDSQGRWDGVAFKDGHANFFPIGAAGRAEAVASLAEAVKPRPTANERKANEIRTLLESGLGRTGKPIGKRRREKLEKRLAELELFIL